ncbi:hypothetical protein BKA56DRAFT_677311 [Ilyonectria sp. MPI-CAGE-AT-0026]|nr:hypothetical protein BKA56DRAFT_677311 [Ilyonectria sp. MPI-CAGE-AT-0026]
MAVVQPQDPLEHDTAGHPEYASSKPPKRISKLKKIWQAPVTMVSFLLVGSALAVGHHRFYLSLRGTVVYGGSEDNDQQLNIRYGTAFAFISKTFLVGAVASAYTQHLWTVLSSSYVKVSTIDSHFTALSSILDFINPRFLSTCKYSTMIALIAWTIPLAALITPATLTVAPHVQYVTKEQEVPTINLETYVNGSENFDVDNIEPQQDRLATYVMAGMQIPPLPTFRADSTYSVNFTGPSLKCQKPNATLSSYIDALFRAAGNETGEVPNAVYVGVTPLFYVRESYNPWWWTESSLSDYSSWLSFVEACFKASDTCRLSLANLDFMSDTSDILWLRLGRERLSCSLQRTTYNIAFDAFNPITSLKNYTFTHHGVLRNDLAIDRENAVGFITVTQALLNVFPQSKPFDGVSY